MTHLTFEQISELAEDGEAAGREADHLGDCAECRETLRKVRGLVAAAHALPRDVAPPPEVWAEVRARMRQPAARRAGSRRWRTGWMAAAAAIVLFVGSVVLMPRSVGKAKGAKPPRPTSTAGLQSPVVVSNVEKNYSAALDELRQTLDSQRETLAPTTIRVVDRSLAAIDTAISETRAALASDPANRALVEILSANYERKVDLLQRATELSPSS